MRYFLDIPRIIDGFRAHPDAASPPVEGCGEHGGEESGEPRGARWGAPWSAARNPVGLGGERGGEDCGAGHGERPGRMGGFAPLEASLRRVAGVSHPYWCNSPLAVGSTLGRRVGNPVGHGGERRGARRGGEWGTPGSTAGRPDHALTDSEAGARPRAPPPLGPATSQVSRRSSGRPSVVPGPE